MAKSLEQNLQELIGSLCFQIAQLQTANGALLERVTELSAEHAFKKGPTLVPPPEAFPVPEPIPSAE